MAPYARQTEVPVERSRAEVQSVLQRWGAEAFMFYEDPTQVVIAFTFKGLTARIPLPMPTRTDASIVKTPVTREPRSPDAQKRAYEQAVRQRWRQLLLLLKANLESIELGIISFEQAFLPFLVLPSGQSVTEQLMPEIYYALETGAQFPMLPPGR